MTCNPQQHFRAASYFGGIGGMLLGAEWAGFLPAFSYEPRKFFNLETFEHNFPSTPVYPTAPSIFPCVDIIMGSPDCKQFSNLGTKRKDREKGRLKGITRDQLYSGKLNEIDYVKFLEMVQQERPRVFVLENIPNILHYFYFEENSLYTTLIQGSEEEWVLRLNDYMIQTVKLDAYEFGVPQHRKRVFVIGALDFEPRFTTEWWKGSHGAQDIYNLHYVGHKVGDVFPVGKSVSNQTLPNHSPKRIEGFRNLAQGNSYYGTQNNKRLFSSKPAWTVASHSSRFVHPTEPRVLTVRETATLMGYPGTFKFFGTESQQLDQVGKSVVPQVAAALCYYIRKQLEYVNKNRGDIS